MRLASSSVYASASRVLDRDEADDAVVGAQRRGEHAPGLGAARRAGAGREVVGPDDAAGRERLVEA